MEKDMRQKVFMLAAVVLAFALGATAKIDIVESVWAATPLNIDGFADDWETSHFHSEKKVKVEYAFRNDSDVLYVLLKFNDPKYLSSIDASGMFIWIDCQGKNRKDLGVKFTKKKISADEYISILEKGQGPVTDKQKERLKASEVYFISHSEAVDKKGNPLEQNKGGKAFGGAAFNVSFQQAEVIYEFRIPCKKLTAAMLGTETEPGEVLGIGFEWGGLTDEMRREYMKGGASGASGRIGISEGGRSGGGTQGIGFDGASPAGLTALRKMSKKHSFWTSVRLANMR
jgi:hypothetical protein